MARQLPTIKLNGVDYFIDGRLQELRRCDDPSQRITEDDLKDEGDFYTVHFIKGTDNQLCEEHKMYEWGSLIECAIPAWALLQQPKEIKNNN